MKRSNLIPITRIYDIYPKYTYSDGVKKFMDEIVDIDRANVYTKEEVTAMLTEIQLEIEEQKRDELSYQQTWNHPLNVCISIIQQKIDKLKEHTERE